MRSISTSWEDGLKLGSKRARGKATVGALAPQLYPYELNGRSGEFWSLFPATSSQGDGHPDGGSELPRLRSIRITKSVDQDVQTCSITYGGRGMTGGITPDMLVRTYEGYESLHQSGVWLVDDVNENSDGTVTLECRDLARELLESAAYPPVVPKSEYPIWFHNPETDDPDGEYADVNQEQPSPAQNAPEDPAVDPTIEIVDDGSGGGQRDRKGSGVTVVWDPGDDYSGEIEDPNEAEIIVDEPPPAPGQVGPVQTPFTPNDLPPEAREYSDYVEVVKWFLSWGGFSGGGREPVGTIVDSGTAGIADLTADIFDKKPIMDCINYVKDILGYTFWVDENGEPVFRPAAQTGGTMAVSGSSVVLSGATTKTSRSRRDKIFVGSVDGSVSATVDGPTYGAPLRRVGGWTDKHFVTQEECDEMARQIVVEMQRRMGSGTVTIVGNPALQIDDMLTITSETISGTFHVRGIQSTLDVQAGRLTYDVSLGGAAAGDG